MVDQDNHEPRSGNFRHRRITFTSASESRGVVVPASAICPVSKLTCSWIWRNFSSSSIHPLLLNFHSEEFQPAKFEDFSTFRYDVGVDNANSLAGQLRQLSLATIDTHCPVLGKRTPAPYRMFN